MASWARKVAADPNATTPADIAALRDSGLDDGQIFAITAFVAPSPGVFHDQRLARPDAQPVSAQAGARGRHLRAAGSSSAGCLTWPAASPVSLRSA
jgi:hypothetical protein